MTLTADPPVRIIEPRPPAAFERLGELWRYRRLVWYFGLQLLEKLYRRTWLGPVWIPLRPVITVASSAFVFGGLLGISSGSIPYPLFFIFTTAVWDLFAFTLLWGTRSLDIGRRVLRRMYVPRLTCLVGSVVISGTYFLIYVVMAVIALGVYAIADGRFYLDLGLHTLLAPAALLLVVTFALGIACFTAPFAARARDVRFGVAYALGFWMFLTPVIYPLSQVPDGYRVLTIVNPITAPVEMFRIGLFNEGELPAVAVASALLLTGAVAVSGLRFFNRLEERALDGI